MNLWHAASASPPLARRVRRVRDLATLGPLGVGGAEPPAAKFRSQVEGASLCCVRGKDVLAVLTTWSVASSARIMQFPIENYVTKFA